MADGSVCTTFGIADLRPLSEHAQSHCQDNKTPTQNSVLSYSQEWGSLPKMQQEEDLGSPAFCRAGTLASLDGKPAQWANSQQNAAAASGGFALSPPSRFLLSILVINHEKAATASQKIGLNMIRISLSWVLGQSRNNGHPRLAVMLHGHSRLTRTSAQVSTSELG